METAAVHEVQETFGQLLRRLRENAHLTQGEFATRCDLSRKSVVTWENAEDRPRIDDEMATVNKMADVLGVPVPVLSKKLGWVPAEDKTTAWEDEIWTDARLSEEARQALIHHVRLALSASRTAT